MEIHASKVAGRKGKPVPMSWCIKSPVEASAYSESLSSSSSSFISLLCILPCCFSKLFFASSRWRSIRSLAMVNISRETSQPTQTWPRSSNTWPDSPLPQPISSTKAGLLSSKRNNSIARSVISRWTPIIREDESYLRASFSL